MLWFYVIDCVLLLAGLLVSYAVETGSTHPLLLSSEAKQKDGHENQELDDDDYDDESEKIPKPVTSIVSAYRLLTPSVKVQRSISYIKV